MEGVVCRYMGVYQLRGKDLCKIHLSPHSSNQPYKASLVYKYEKGSALYMTPMARLRQLCCLILNSTFSMQVAALIPKLLLLNL